VNAACHWCECGVSQIFFARKCHLCDVQHVAHLFRAKMSHMRHATWRINATRCSHHTCDMPQVRDICMWNRHRCGVLHIFFARKYHICDMWRAAWTRHPVFITRATCPAFVTYMWHRYIYVTSLWMRRVARTGWRRRIGCLKLQVIFRKRATIYRALLQKMTYEDKASYESSPLCIPRTKTSHLCCVTL